MSRSRALIIVAVATLAFAPPAAGQIGGLIKKKVAEKVVDKVVDKALPDKPDATSSGSSKRATRYAGAVVGEELTSDALDATIRGLRIEVAIYSRSDSLAQQSNALSSRAPSGDEERDYRDKLARVEECQAAFFPSLEQKRFQEMEQRIRKPSSPVSAIHRWEEARVRYQQDLTAAMMRGDTAAIVKLRRSFWQSQGIAVDTKADTMAAVAQCGALPPKPASMAERERADTLRVLSRRLQEQFADSGAAASGLSAMKYSLAKERLRTWWEDVNERRALGKGAKDKSTAEHVAVAARFWADREQNLLESRRSQLAPLMKKLFGLNDA